jgi:hypothetical protein
MVHASCTYVTKAPYSCYTIAPLGTLTMHLLIGRTPGHHRITAKLGEGGMGEAYCAHDERLDGELT